jgi:hypothetical protein
MPALSFLAASSQFARALAAVTVEPLSMFCWYQPTADIGSIIMSLSEGTDLHRHVLSTNITTRVVSATSGAASSSSAITANGDTLNSWNCAVGIFAGATLRTTILNGDKANKGTDVVSITGHTTPTRVSIGCRDSSTQGAFFTGLIGECGIYNAILTDDEAVDICFGVNPRKVRPHALKGLWPHPGVGGICQDWYGNPMAITGAAASASSPPRMVHVSR